MCTVMERIEHAFTTICAIFDYCEKNVKTEGMDFRADGEENTFTNKTDGSRYFVKQTDYSGILLTEKIRTWECIKSKKVRR